VKALDAAHHTGKTPFTAADLYAAKNHVMNLISIVGSRNIVTAIGAPAALQPRPQYTRSRSF
jgi:hypothetical protein